MFIQCRLACDHQAKLFAYDQLKFSAEVKRVAMKQLRTALLNELSNDTSNHKKAIYLQVVNNRFELK